MKKCRSLFAVWAAACLLVSLLAGTACATDLTDLAAEEEITFAATFVYGEDVITVIGGQPQYVDLDSVPMRSGARTGIAYPIYLYSADGSLLLKRTVTLTVEENDDGTYSFGPARDWDWYTTNIADDVLLSGVKNTRISDTTAEHAFTWKWGDVSYRCTCTFTLDSNTGSFVMSGFTNEPR